MVAVAAVAVACGAPRTYSGGGRGCPDGPDGEQRYMTAAGCTAEPANADGNAVRPVPPAERHHRMVEQTGVDGIRVLAEPSGAASWTLTVMNESDAPLTVLFDESSFVTSSGNSWGRLIRGETRKMNSAQAQPPIPVAPRARLSGFVVPEGAIAFEEFESWVVGRMESRNVGTAVKRAERERAHLKKELDGGRLLLVVQRDGEKKTWTGLVVAN